MQSKACFVYKNLVKSITDLNEEYQSITSHEKLSSFTRVSAEILEWHSFSILNTIVLQLFAKGIMVNSMQCLA